MSIRIANNDISVVVHGDAIAPYPVDPPENKAHDEGEEKGKAKGKSKSAAKPTAWPDQVERENVLVWVELAPGHPKAVGAIWATLVNGTGAFGVQRNDPLAEDAAREAVKAADDDRDHLQKVVVDQHFETVLTTLDAQGNFVTATEPQQIKDLLDRYVKQLAKLVEARNVPQYDLRPEPWEWAVFDPLSKDRHLPGRVETELTTFQKHLSIALGRSSVYPLGRRHPLKAFIRFRPRSIDAILPLSARSEAGPLAMSQAAFFAR